MTIDELIKIAGSIERAADSLGVSVDAIVMANKDKHLPLHYEIKAMEALNEPED